MIYRIIFILLLVCSGCSKSAVQRSAEPLSKPAVQPPQQPVAYEMVRHKMERRKLIVIDAGHGGKDMGAQSCNKPLCYEKHLTLTTAHMLNQYLQGMGYRTIMTRNNDVYIPLDGRAEFANDKRPALFVSVHYNSAPSPKAEGVEVYYYESEKDIGRTKESKVLAKAVLEQSIVNTQAKSRGIKHGNFAVIRETKMPAILVEGGFLTNEGEMDRIRDAAYMKRLALGIANGIKQYLNKK